MREVLRIALHDLRLVLTDRSAVMWMAVMPVAFAGFFGLVTGGGGGAQDAKARLTVVDLDRGPVAAVLLESLASERLEVVEMTPDERAVAENPVRTLVIPEGFSTRVVAGEQVTLRLEKEEGASEEASLVVSARLVGAIARVIGRVVEAAEEGPPTPEAVAAVPPSPDLVTVDVRWAGRAAAQPDGFTQSIPGMVVMFVLLVALTYGSASLSAERAGGQLRRLVTAPLDRSQIVAGKIAGKVVVAWAQIAVLVTVAVVAQLTVGIPIGDHPFGVLAVLAVYALAVAPLGVLFGALLSDPDQAAGVGVVATMVMAALGGCWWPLEVVSPTLQKVALAFPSGWAMTALHRLISFGDPPAAVLGHVAALLGFAAVFAGLAVRSLRLE